MKIGNVTFDFTKDKTYIMGILNVTPDSFSDGGDFNEMKLAMEHVKQMMEDGADIIDVGGESTRPGHTQITEEDEINRVVPMIREIKRNFSVPVSIDTYKSKVARAALEAGADLINDIWGFKYDDKMAVVAKEYDVAVCLMHNRKEIDYKNYMDDVCNDLLESVAIAKKAGISEDKIILDPGVGFAKTFEMNLEVIAKLEKIKKLGYPVLLGTSRKSVIGLALDLPVTEREEGTIATSVIGAVKGCEFVRVHDVKKNKRALQMTNQILAYAD